MNTSKPVPGRVYHVRHPAKAYTRVLVVSLDEDNGYVRLRDDEGHEIEVETNKCDLFPANPTSEVRTKGLKWCGASWGLISLGWGALVG